MMEKNTPRDVKNINQVYATIMRQVTTALVITGELKVKAVRELIS